MSLINEVLKDLERRQGRQEVSPRPASGADRARPSNAALRRWPLWLAAAVLTGAVLHFGLDAESPGSAEARPQPLEANSGSNAAVERAERPDPGKGQRQPARSTAGKAGPSPSAAAAVARAEIQPSPRPDRESSTAETADDRDMDDGPAAEAANTSEASEEPAAPSDPSPARDEEPDDASPERDSGSGPRISIQRAGQPRESDPLERARRALANGRADLAESRLRGLVDRRPGLSEAWELLATLLIERNRHAAAAALLERGLERAEDPAGLAALLARLQLEAGNARRAGNVLERYAPPLADAPDYHLLLAAAHRQAGRHEAAAEHYRRLGEMFPGRAAAWIGLGVSLEALEQPDSARDAYERAVAGGDARAARFARERLSVLNEPTGDPR